jgi:hypothetical protein
VTLAPKTPRRRPVAKPAHEYVDDEASKIIRGPRRMTYCDPKVSFDTIAQTWNAYLERRGDIGPLTGYDVAQFMILLKVIRGAGGYHRDSSVDTVGYAILAEVVSDEAAYADFTT